MCSARRKEISAFEIRNKTGGALEVQGRFRVFVLLEKCRYRDFDKGRVHE
jgi:hypothetical protein